MNGIIELSEAYEKELQAIKDKEHQKAREHPHFKSYVKYWAGEHKAGRDRDGKKAAVWGVTKDDTKAHNDAEKANKKQLKEDAMPVNTVSGGSIATKEQPIGKVQKRKPLEETAEDGVTDVDSDEQKKRMFHLKQDQSNQISD